MSVRDTSIDPRLIESARREFLEHGFLKADLKTICENAGVTTGAVYKRYKGKEELFCAVVEGIVGELDSFLELRSGVDFSALSDDEIRESSLGIVANILPYFFLYQIISPLTRGQHVDFGFVMIRVIFVAVCEMFFALFYVKGLEFSHISA